MNSEEKHFINQRKMQKTITRDTIVKQRRAVARILESKFGMNAINNLKATTKIKLKRKLLGD